MNCTERRNERGRWKEKNMARTAEINKVRRVERQKRKKRQAHGKGKQRKERQRIEGKKGLR